jgi:predicted  nucleic acid-binding Zn-ribbon protein
MNRTSILVFALTLLLAVALQSAAVDAAPQPKSGPLPDRQVNGRADPCVRLRSSGSLDATVLDCLEPGTRLRLLGAISGWSHVRLLDGAEGWLDSGFLEMAPQPAVRQPAGEPPAPPPEDRQSADLLKQIETLEGQLQAAANRREATEEQLRKTVAAAEAAQNEARQLRQRVEQLEAAPPAAAQLDSQLAAMRARVQELEPALSAAEERLVRAAELNAEQERRIEALVAAVAAGRAGETDSRQKLAATQARLQASEETSAAQMKRIQQLEGELPALQAGGAESRAALAAVQQRLQAAEQGQAEQASRIEELTGQLADAELRIAESDLRARLAGQTEPAQSQPTQSLSAPSRPAPSQPAAGRVEVRAPVVAAPEPSKSAVRMPAAVLEQQAAAAAEPAAGGQITATDAAIDAVRAWAAAWSDQRTEDYLSFYAPGFRPPGGLSRDAWEAQRRQRLSRPSYIRVTITALSAELADDGTVRATFGQDYESNAFADSVTKVLTLTERQGRWQILAEQAEP